MKPNQRKTRMTDEEMAEEARKIKQWLQEACIELGQGGGSADELYNDVDTLEDRVGDRIFDAGGTYGERMVIAAEIGASAHPALQKAVGRFIRRMEAQQEATREGRR